MNFKTFIEKIGDEQAAALFDVPVRTVASWRRGERKPRPKQAQQIVARTGNEVSYEDIYGNGDRSPTHNDPCASPTRKDACRDAAA